MKLLCTDLDRTLLPNGVQEESVHARPLLWHLLNSQNVSLAYVSGRDLARVLDAIEEYELPIPDFIVGDVGSSVYSQTDTGWQQRADWIDTISQQWRGGDSTDVHELLKDMDQLQVQEEDRQTAFKRSYYFDEALDEAELGPKLRHRLESNRFSAALVFSHDPEKQLGLLDVVPASATKREAVAYLQSLYDISGQDVLFAGDSGNDVSAICAPRPAVLVANADASTRRLVLAENAVSLKPETTYIATGGLEVAGQEPLNGCYAAGIVEGLVNFRPDWRQCISDAKWVDAALQQMRMNT